MAEENVRMVRVETPLLSEGECYTTVAAFPTPGCPETLTLHERGPEGRDLTLGLAMAEPSTLLPNRELGNFINQTIGRRMTEEGHEEGSTYFQFIPPAA